MSIEIKEYEGFKPDVKPSKKKPPQSTKKDDAKK